jgi:hypothetical protein
MPDAPPTMIALLPEIPQKGFEFRISTVERIKTIFGIDLR